jgi:hypothetical protein
VPLIEDVVSDEKPVQSHFAMLFATVLPAAVNVPAMYSSFWNVISLKTLPFVPVIADVSVSGAKPPVQRVTWFVVVPSEMVNAPAAQSPYIGLDGSRSAYTSNTLPLQPPPSGFHCTPSHAAMQLAAVPPACEKSPPAKRLWYGGSVLPMPLW